ncbi:MAG: hypothetical protein ACOCXP_02985 [Candidatus Dojkabacteria bacterium]
MNKYETNTESTPIAVNASYYPSRPPLLRYIELFGQVHQVNNSQFAHAIRRGREKVYIFSVLVGANNYRLRFETDTLKWYLES